MRLFVALDIPNAVREALTAISGDLRKLSSAGRWVSTESAHITLKFIGETPDKRVEDIRRALGRVRTNGAFEVQFSRLGFFPNARRPRVLWAGVIGGAVLSELAAAIEAQLEPLGIAREVRRFSPHITLARFESTKGLERLRDAVEKLGAIEFGHTMAGEFYLYRSVLRRAGAEYTRLAGYRFSGEPAS